MKTSILYRVMALVAVAAIAISNISFVSAQQKSIEKKQKKSAEKRLNGVWKTQSPVEGFEPVDLWDAMASGDVEVIYRPHDAYQANVTVKNKSDRHLAIKMPSAFASMPIMAQGLGGGGLGGGGLGGGQGGGGLGGGGFGAGGGGNQGGGGGFGGGQGGGGFGGGGGGLGGGGGGGGGPGLGGAFNIPPGRDGMVKVKTVCLEHEKTDPTPQMNYTIRPIAELNKDPKIKKLCEMLATDQVDHGVAQAAAWNIANSLSWDLLAVKNRVELMDGYFERFFTIQQIQVAQQLVTKINQDVELDSRSKSDEDSRESSRGVKVGTN